MTEFQVVSLNVAMNVLCTLGKNTDLMWKFHNVKRKKYYLFASVGILFTAEYSGDVFENEEEKNRKISRFPHQPLFSLNLTLLSPSINKTNLCTYPLQPTLRIKIKNIKIKIKNQIHSCCKRERLAKIFFSKKKDEQIIGVIKLGFLMSKGQLEITVFEAKLFIEKPLGKLFGFSFNE